MSLHDDIAAIVSRRQWLLGAASLSACTLLHHKAMAADSIFSSQRLSIETVGTRTTKAHHDIILIPGLASSPSIWNSLRKSLNGYRLHLVHISGFAGKAAQANAQGPLLTPIVDELARYIKEAKLSNIAIIGHSMGGTLAMMLGLRSNINLARIMVVDMLPDGTGMIGGTSAGLGFLAGQLHSYFTGTRAGRQLLANMVANSPGGRDSNPGVIANALVEMAQTDLTEALSSLRCPLHVTYALPADAQMAAEQHKRYRMAYSHAPKAYLQGIGPSGHMIMSDQPMIFTRAVKKFLR